MKKLILLIGLLFTGSAMAQMQLTPPDDLLLLLAPAGSSVFVGSPSITLGRNGGNSGEILFIASDNDQGTLTISTTDRLLIAGFGGGIQYSGLTRLSINTTNRNTSWFTGGDITAGVDAYVFTSGDASWELFDANAQQAWLRISPRVAHSSTAAFDAFTIEMDEEALGDGTTGVGNNYLRFVNLSAVTEYRIDLNGNVFQSGGINYGADAQADDDYEISLPGVTTLTTGMSVTFSATTLNTDGATFEITEMGDIDALVKAGTTSADALATGDIVAGQIITAVFDGTNWQITSKLAQ